MEKYNYVFLLFDSSASRLDMASEKATVESAASETVQEIPTIPPNPLPFSLHQEFSEEAVLNSQLLSTITHPLPMCNPDDKVSGKLAVGYSVTADDIRKKLRDENADKDPKSGYFNLDGQYRTLQTAFREHAKKQGWLEKLQVKESGISKNDEKVGMQDEPWEFAAL